MSNYNPILDQETRTEYCDISFWQGEVDWDNLDPYIMGAMLKTSEANFRDRMFLKYVDGCEEYGLDWGVYHFYRSWCTGVAQAQLVINVLNGRKPDLPICLDLEADNGANMGLIADSARAFCEYIVEYTDITPIIYTCPGFMYKFYGLYRSRIQWMKDYPLWMATYPWEKAPKFIEDFSLYRQRAVAGAWIPKACYPWTQWEMWQWTGHGRLTGMRGDVDMNVTFGQITPPPVPPTPATKVYKVTALLGLRVRSEPNTVSAILRTLSYGAMVGIDKIENGWGYSETQGGWLFMQYLTRVG